MNQIIVLGLSHKTAPVEVREKISVDSVNLPGLLNGLIKWESIGECVVVSTCNRTEIYAVTDDTSQAERDIRDTLINSQRIDLSTLDQHLYSYVNGGAVKHLIRVACSLDSMIIGEPQILGQVKESYNSSKNNETVGIVLNRLFQYAFFVAKKVRTKTNIGGLAVSISYLAVELSKRIFDDLAKRSVMLVGTGDMAVLAARNLINAGLKNLVIASRNYDNADLLSKELRGTPIKLEEIYYRLKDVDIVITATGSNDFIIKSDHVQQALKLRKNEPMFFIDIAVPRDIDPRVNDIPSVYLYDIDDLQGVLDQNVNSRKEGALEAESMVEEHSAKFIRWLDGLKVLPTILKLKNKMEIIKESELEWAFGKLDPMSEDEKKIIEKLAERIIDKVLHEPLTGLKKESSSTLGTLYSDTIQKIYNLDTELEIVEDTEDNVKDWN